MSTAEHFKGNPYLEMVAERIDESMQRGDTNFRVDEDILKLAEMFEQRTANMLAYQESGKPTTKGFKDQIRGRLGAETPTSQGATFL